MLGILVFPAVASAQTIKEADIVGGWRGVAVDLPASVLAAQPDWGNGDAPKDLTLVLWPDHLWAYQGPIMLDGHGGARWRLVGDTLWLGNDFGPYYHPIIEQRNIAYRAKGLPNWAIDRDVIRSHLINR